MGAFGIWGRCNHKCCLCWLIFVSIMLRPNAIISSKVSNDSCLSIAIDWGGTPLHQSMLMFELRVQKLEGFEVLFCR